MKTKAILFLILTALVQFSCVNNHALVLSDSRDQLFDDGWKFIKDSTINAEMPDYDDQSWRTVDLPHDWSIEDLPGEQNADKAGPFVKSSIGAKATGYVSGGTGWYRNRFKLKQENKTVILRFDGVYMESDVWVNGKHVGYHPYGYTPFNYDITSFLNSEGRENIIAVRVKNIGKNSRWYSGSGIYRHVWITVAEPIHVDVWGAYITTPVVTKDTAVASIHVKIKNASANEAETGIRIKLIAPDGKIVESLDQTVKLIKNGDATIEQSIPVPQPALWSVDMPQLYKAEITLFDKDRQIDQYTTTFGIRSIEYSAEKGLLINGQSIELKGGCMHHDNGMLGSATYDRAEERRIENMKKNGFNAIRTSHNPPSQQFLDACDRLGMVVIDEAFDMWERPKNPDDYHKFFIEWHERDLASMLLRDRNHPSVIFWSIGNEINERGDTSGYRIAQNLIDIVHQYDTTRPITEAICGFWDHPGWGWEKTEKAFSFLNIGGYNYQCQEYINDHKKFPKRMMMGTESFPLEAYKNWHLVEQCSWVIGDFVWTGMDYLGETGIGHTRYADPSEKDEFSLPWPWVNAWCGDIDICGNKKAQSYYRDVVWGESKIEIAVHSPIPAGKVEKVSMWGWPDEYQHWNWGGNEGKQLQVNVYSSCPVVQLKINDKIIGEKKISPDSNLTARFYVPYEAGKLEAVAMTDGKEVSTKIIETTGTPASVRLTAEKSEISNNKNDLAYFAIDIIDEKGSVVPTAELSVELTIEGEGKLLAAGSAVPNEPQSYQDNACKTYQGKALLIVRPTGKSGKIKATAKSAGLKESSIEIIVR